MSSKYPVECDFCGITDEYLHYNINKRQYLCDYCNRWHGLNDDDDMIVFCDRCNTEVSINNYPNKEQYICPMCETETASVLTYIEFQMSHECDPSPGKTRMDRARDYIVEWVGLTNATLSQVISEVSKTTGRKASDIVADYATRYDWHMALDRVMMMQEEVTMLVYTHRLHDMLAARNNKSSNRLSDFIKTYPMTICPTSDDLAQSSNWSGVI